jgi:hypothetical protein
MMKRKLILGIFFIFTLMNMACATYYEENFTTKPSYRSSMSNSDIDIQSLRYEPYPVNPGEYVKLYIKVQNMGNSATKNAVFELIPKYPFSLDANENPIRKYGELDSRPVVLEYKIRVDKNAVESQNEIVLRYDPAGTDSSGSIDKKFYIQVENVQTEFDLVVQEVSGTQVSIAIANTGKNPAYSTIVKIPEQDSFSIIGTSGQMVGNLEDGDYTLVGFDLTAKNVIDVIKKRNSTNNPPQFMGKSQTDTIDNPSLKVQIDYTDTIGERRTIIKEIPINEGLSSFATGNITTRTTNFANGFPSSRNSIKTTQSLYQKWWFWLIIIIIMLALWKGYKVFQRKKEESESNKYKKKQA